MGNPQGIDISSHQTSIDWQQAAAGGLSFAFIKATEGNAYRSPLFPAQWAGAKAAGIIRGAYAFFRWDVDPAAQAAFFLAALGDDKGELPLTVDVEGTGDGAGMWYIYDANGHPVLNSDGTPKLYDATEAVRRVRVFVDALKAATGRTVIIYTYPSMWQQTLGNPRTFTDCLLWLASYKVAPPLPVGGWQEVTFWQFTARGTVQGVGGLVDRDYYMGTLDGLRKLAGLDTGGQDSYLDPVTNQYIAHGFLSYWQAHPYLGHPLTGEFTRTLEDGNQYTVQLFERGLLHWAMGQDVGEARIGFMWGKEAGVI